MATVRIMPANDLAKTSIVNGRTYTCPAGGTLDVPDFDAFALLANGWVNAAGGQTLTLSGPTSQRPTRPAKGQAFHDTTLGKTITFNGASWRDPATGGLV